MLAMLKALLRSGPMQWLIGLLIGISMALVRHTTRWTVIGREHAEPVWRSGKGVVWCYWHSRFMGARAMWPMDAQPILMLISQSPDGQFVARATEMNAAQVVRGSTAKKKKSGDGGELTEDKGGVQAFRRMVAHGSGGGCVGITPDGPRGPRQIAQAGAVRVAKAARIPLLPTAYAVQGTVPRRSWDRLHMPPFFRRGWIVYGPPIHLPARPDDSALERARADLEAGLNAVTREADRLAGVPHE